MGEDNPAANLSPAPPETARARRRRTPLPPWVWISILAFTLVVVLPLGIYCYGRLMFIRTYKLPSGAMEPTLKAKSFIMGDELPYTIGDPQRGEIAVFRYPNDPALDYVKRVIGLPGDIVEVRGGTVYVNDEALVEPYVAEPAWADFGPETVPEEHYFVLGDNRNHSSDSRVWGYVPRDHFETRVMFH